MGKKRSKRQPDRRKDALQVSLGFLLVAVLLLALAGGCLASRRDNESTTATVTSSAGCSYRYEYTVDGRTYHQRVHRWSTSSSGRRYCPASRRPDPMFRDGHRFEVWYDPEHPGLVGAETSSRDLRWAIPLGIFVVLFAAIGIAGISYGLRLPRRG